MTGSSTHYDNSKLNRHLHMSEAKGEKKIFFSKTELICNVRYYEIIFFLILEGGKVLKISYFKMLAFC